MSEKSVPLPIEKAYEILRNILLKNKCKIIEKKSPEYILVEQGSLSGVLPRSAKKVITYYLSPEGVGTKVVTSTKIASDWANLTLIGNVLAAVLAGIFLWIASDLENFVQTAKPDFWTWLVRAYGDSGLQYTLFMVYVARALAVFLALMILVEILIVIYVYPRKNAFAQEMLRALH